MLWQISGLSLLFQGQSKNNLSSYWVMSTHPLEHTVRHEKVKLVERDMPCLMRTVGIYCTFVIVINSPL